MKKLITIFVVAVLCFGLFACSGKTDTSAPSGGNASAPPSGSSSAPPVPAVPQGYPEDDVDHHARDTYDIAFLCDDYTFLQQSWFSSMVAFEERFNIKMTAISAEGDMDTFLANIELITTRGFDGAIVTCMPDIYVRATELLYESEIPWLAYTNTVVDDNGHTVAPTVSLDPYSVGWNTMKWLVDNYKSYWGEIDESKLGAIDITVSTSPDLLARSEGPHDLFTETFPNSTHFQLDAVSTGRTGMGVVSEESAYDLVSATVAANPQIEYWLVTGAVEFYGVGSARALEALGKTTDNALVCVVGSGVNFVDWDSMSDDTKTVNVACLFLSDLRTSIPAVSGIVALIDGRVTKDTLWREKTPPNYKYGNDFGVWLLDTEVVTRATYKQALAFDEKLVLG